MDCAYLTKGLGLVIATFFSINVVAAERDVIWDFSAAYRVDSLDWNIASDPSGTLTPNILSELTWSDLKIIDLKVEFVNRGGDNSYARGYFAYGIIMEGDNQDSDYNGDNRTLEFSRSNNSSDGRKVIDA